MTKNRESWEPLAPPKNNIRYMSDSKGRKLFAILASENLGVGRIHYHMTWGGKPAGDDSPHIIEKPPHHPCHENCGFGCIKPTYIYSFGAPYHRIYYREIAFIRIPTKWSDEPYEKVPFAHHRHNLDQIQAAISAVGQFEMEGNESRLTIFGYKPA